MDLISDGFARKAALFRYPIKVAKRSNPHGSVHPLSNNLTDDPRNEDLQVEGYHSHKICSGEAGAAVEVLPLTPASPAESARAASARLGSTVLSCWDQRS